MMVRLLQRFLILVIGAALALPGSSCDARAAASSSGKYALTPAQVAGWHGTVTDNRNAPNGLASGESRVAGRYFYTGSLPALDRTGGWFESMKLTRGRVTATIVDLVSLFPSDKRAGAAYAAMVPSGGLHRSSLPFGTRAVSVIESSGVASGTNGELWFQTLNVFVWAGRMVAEVSAQEDEQSGPGFVNPLPNAAAAVAQALAKQAGMPSTTIAVRRARGVVLQVSVPRTTYPADALVRATLRLTNVSGQTLYVQQMDAVCSLNGAGVQVKNGAGQVVSTVPPEIPALPCPYPLPDPLKPGTAITQHPYIVLRGDRVQGDAIVSTTQSPQGAQPIRTPLIVLTLTTATPPTLTTVAGPEGPIVTVHQPNGATGHLLYEGWTGCDVTNGEAIDYHLFAPLPDDTVSGGCPILKEWHFIVGRLNHSVAQFDYTSGAPVPPSPPSP